jgi:hypothetical protein
MPRTLPATFLSLLLLLALAVKDGATQGEPSVAPGINDRYATEEGRAQSLQILEGEGREKYQKPDEIIRRLALKPGDVVCEVGAGSGYFTPYLSQAVGGTGKVYAEDPQAEFLEQLEKRKQAQGLRNVEIVLGTCTDTNLPDGLCDVTFVLTRTTTSSGPRRCSVR